MKRAHIQGLRVPRLHAMLAYVAVVGMAALSVWLLGASGDASTADAQVDAPAGTTSQGNTYPPGRRLPTAGIPHSSSMYTNLADAGYGIPNVYHSRPPIVRSGALPARSPMPVPQIQQEAGPG